MGRAPTIHGVGPPVTRNGRIEHWLTRLVATGLFALGCGGRSGIGSPSRFAVADGNGTMGSADVTDVCVTCALPDAGPPAYPIGGTATGLSGGTLVLQNNGGDDLALTSNGTFAFPTPLVDGATYDVTVATQPAGQTCGVENGRGTLAGAAVTNVLVSCTTLLAGPLPVYPGHGASWNDYVKNDGAGPFDASDMACDPETDGPDYFACLHGGELRAVPVPGHADCAGLTIFEALGVFDWVCDESTVPVRFVSMGLRDGKNLSDLLDFDAPTWAANVVEVFHDGDFVGLTAPAAWWGNPVEEQTAASTPTEGTIYVVTAQVEPEYWAPANRTAVVTKPGVVLVASEDRYAGGAFGDDFVWVEAAVEVPVGALGGVFLGSARFSVARNLAITVHDGEGLEGLGRSMLLTDIDVLVTGSGFGIAFFDASEGTHVRNARIDCSPDVQGIGLIAYEASGVHFDRVRTSGCAFGVLMQSLANVSVSNLTAVGGSLLFEAVDRSRLWNLLAIDSLLQVAGWTGAESNTMWGVTLVGGDVAQHYADVGNRYSDVLLIGGAAWPPKAGTTSSLTAVNGAAVFAVRDNTLANALVDGGVTAGGDSRFVADNLAATTYALNAITLQNLYEGAFSGLLLVGDNGAECLVSGGISPGLVDDAVGITNCGIAGASTATVVGGTHLLDSFVGPIYVDDAVNSSDDNGAAGFEEIDDWSSFENRHRVWGRDDGGLPFPDPAHAPPCQAGDACRIWDWSLRASDTTLRDVVGLPDGNDVTTHQWPADVSECSAAPGGVWDPLPAPTGTCRYTFLRNAVEVQLDGIGNDNLLCESGETCLHTPNIGSYQGHGDLVPAGSIGAGGAISNVSLLRYEVNGR